MTVPKYRLTYFNWMWIAEPTRFLLSYVGEDFEDVRLSYEEWMKDDSKIIKNGFPYGKLPVLEDRENNLRLGQSFAIGRYLAGKYNLVGETVVDAAKCDEYADVLKDMLGEVEPMWRADEKRKAEIKAAFLEKTVLRYFSVIETDLKNNGGKYLVGKTTTWVDFLCAHFTEMFQIYLNTDILTNYPALKAHQQQVFEISAIKEWKDKRPVTPY